MPGAMGAEMVAVVVMVLEAEVKSGDGEGEGEGTTELKQASSELPRLLFSTVIMLKRSRPEDAAALLLPSEGTNGSLGEGEELGERVRRKKCNTWRARGEMLDNDFNTEQSRYICFM